MLFRDLQQSLFHQPKPAEASKDTWAFPVCGQRHWTWRGFRHRSLYRELCRLCMVFSTWYVWTSKDFSSKTAKYGVEGISPQYQFDTWSRHKPFLNKILIEIAQKGSAVLQKLKFCSIHINFKLLCWKQSLIFCYSSHRDKEGEDCDLRAGISAKMFTYRKELLSANLIICFIFLAAC